MYNVPLFRKAVKPTHRELLPHTAGVTRTVPPATFALTIPLTPYDQGPIGSCVANAACAAFRIQADRDYFASRLFVYYVGRARAGLIGEEGMYIDDAFLSLRQQGVCPEATWPYLIRRENRRPPRPAYRQALRARIASWGVVSTAGDLIANVKTVLQQGVPIVIGVAVFESFEGSAATNEGLVPVPDPDIEDFLGGHALCLVGWDDEKSAFLTLNSWGTDWGCAKPGDSSGARGFCYMPYAYIDDSSLCDECVFSTATVFGRRTPQQQQPSLQQQPLQHQPALPVSSPPPASAAPIVGVATAPDAAAVPVGAVVPAVHSAEQPHPQSHLNRVPSLALRRFLSGAGRVPPRR